MRYHPIPQKLFVNNRKRFAKKLKAGGLAVFNSNDIMPANADGAMPFIQNTDIFYLSGIDQEESILVIFPDAKLKEQKEILFLKETKIPELLRSRAQQKQWQARWISKT